MRNRNLAWDGCVNVRDLGGHRTQDGSETRFGAIVRADSARQLSDEGWTAAVAYGIRTVLDLRFQSELEADPPRELPVETVHLPLLGDPSSPHWPEIDAIGDAAGDPRAATRAVYLEFLERFRENFGAAITTVARAREGGVLVHCQGGKDRTGLVSALLLRLAGVPAKDVAGDYAVSAANLAPLLAGWIAEGEDERERARRRRIAASPAEAMLDVLAELARRYGDERGYLRAAGVSDGDLVRARARLRA